MNSTLRTRLKCHGPSGKERIKSPPYIDGLARRSVDQLCRSVLCIPWFQTSISSRNVLGDSLSRIVSSAEVGQQIVAQNRELV